MIIVDTSVWIEFFRAHPHFFSLLKSELERQTVPVLACVFGELLQGVRDRRERDFLLQYWNTLPHIEETNLWIEAGILSSENRLPAKGIGLIDAFLIATTRRHHARLWTLDKKLQSVLSPNEIYKPAD